LIDRFASDAARSSNPTASTGWVPATSPTAWDGANLVRSRMAAPVG
jgi:hypothetical protein